MTRLKWEKHTNNKDEIKHKPAQAENQDDSPSPEGSMQAFLTMAIIIKG